MTKEFEVIDGEHRVQIGLLDALHDAVRQERPAPVVREILDRVTEYSRLHFLSEQLLMRLHAYPEYEDHVRDHERILEALERLGAAIAEGRTALSVDRVDGLRTVLVEHIRGRDGRLGEFLDGAAAGGGV